MKHTSLLWLACMAAAMLGAAAPAAAREKVLHTFECPPRGAIPYAGVIRDDAGNLSRKSAANL